MTLPDSDLQAENVRLRQALKQDAPLQFTLHWLRPPPYPNLNPIKPGPYRAWWEKDRKTRNHAKFCLPLLMANQAGYYIPSPVEAEILAKAEGSPDIKVLRGNPKEIDAHSATNSFTIQPMCVFRTLPGYLSFVKGIPNERGPRFTVMEAMIESWWTPANFGIVCLPRRPGLIRIKLGEPIAQVLFVHTSGLRAELSVSDVSAHDLPHRQAFEQKRAHYKPHELDYFRGKTPDGASVCPHFKPASPRPSVRG